RMDLPPRDRAAPPRRALSAHGAGIPPARGTRRDRAPPLSSGRYAGAHPHAERVMEQRRLLRDSLFNLSASVFSALLGLLAVPLFVARLPTADYADWIVMLATAKTTVIVDLGVGWTVVHIIAQETGRLRAETIAQLRTAATILGALSVTVALV